MPRMDRRSLKTRLALRDALLHALAEVPWDALDVQALCARANVGRSTFYLHYRHKDELLDASLDDLRQALAAAPAPPGGASLPWLAGLMAHMLDQRRVFRAVVGRRSSQVVATRFRAMVARLALDSLATAGQPVLPAQQMQAHALAGALVDLMAWWVDAAEPVPAPQLHAYAAEVAQRLLR